MVLRVKGSVNLFQRKTNCFMHKTKILLYFNVILRVKPTVYALNATWRQSGQNTPFTRKINRLRRKTI